MDDRRIIELFFARDERAISETEKKYGALCRYIAGNILASREDVEECVSDVMLALWNAIPPNHPLSLSAFISEITRHLAIKKFRSNSATKRSGIDIVSDEFLLTLDDGSSLSELYESKRAGELISRFLRELPEEERTVFMMRYYFDMNISDIALRHSCSEGRIKMKLLRTRKKLSEYLKKEGIIV